MRDIYYQSVGNPSQTDRLPATRPATELISVDPKSMWLLSLHSSMLCSIVGTAILLIYRVPGLAWLDPYDLLLTMPVILWALTNALQEKSLDRVLDPIVLLAIGIACLNYRVPVTIRAVLTALMLGVFVYQYGRHCVAFITAPPMARDDSNAVRAGAVLSLRFLAGGIAILLALMFRLNWPLIKLAVVTLPVAMLLSQTPRRLLTPRWKYFSRCLTLWFSYNPKQLPGVLQSPAGTLIHRVALTILVTELTSISLLTWDRDLIPTAIGMASQQQAAVDATSSNVLEKLKHTSITWFLTFAGISSLPLLLPLALAVGTTTPVVLEAGLEAQQSIGVNETQAIVADIQHSNDPIEKDSIFLGRVVQDGSPVLVPRKIFTEHAHGLGDSGSGKTSLFLCPLIEQLAASGDCSIIVIDLKADTLELLATLTAAAEKLRNERGTSIPVKCFSNQADRSSFAFNPMTQSFWSKFDLLTKTDILCGANGLTYGTEYGQGYFSSANSAVLYHALKSFPHVKTFEELADCIGNVIKNAKSNELHAEIKKAGVHVQEVMKRLANCGPLNVTSSTGHEADVVDQAIDLTQPFLTPQFLYFHLSATLSPSGAPEIGRLVNYMLLAASTQTERKHQVFLVIDEFQRMVAGNLEYMLQLARSMGVGVILANQSMEDLKKSNLNLIPPIEANCRLRQWFSVSSSEDQERLIKSSGETVDIEYSRRSEETSEGNLRYSYSEKETKVPRITFNDILLTSDHPFRSFLRIGRGAGYAQYGGLPFIVESQFHISEKEYQRRRAMPWPTLPGMMPPPNQTPRRPDAIPSGPTFTQDVVGDSKQADDFFNGMKNYFEPPKPRRQKKAQS